MKKITFFLILLAVDDVVSSSKNAISNREKRDAVLIRSKRRWVLSTIDLEENMPGPYPATVTTLYNDKKEDTSVKFRIKGQGVTEKPFGLFSIDENKGTVYVHRPIDREEYPLFHVDFDVLDRKTDATVDKTLSFNVEIKDKNDNSPVFTTNPISLYLPENTPEGVLQATLQAHDNDQKDTLNSQFTMKVVSQEPASPNITIRDMHGTSTVQQLTFTGCFDYDKAKQYKVLVEAKDQGTPPMSSTATAILFITDSNTHPPEFSSATYNTRVDEMELKEILRIGIKDMDAPNTPASRAVFSITKGNEENNYKIETDPKTNEGVLSVVKGKNFLKTETVELEIEVENEEPLFQCVNGKPVTGTKPKPNTAKVAVEVIDSNDPPVFKNPTEKVYRNENGPIGDVLFVPEIKDEDSDISKLRYEIVQDPAQWVSVDQKTGKITTVKTMDRESPFVKNGIYTVEVHAIDDGVPPGTGTCTVMVHLGDLNDNAPELISKSTVMCGNKVDRVDVSPRDLDNAPFANPFTFFLGREELKSLWKLDPTTGTNTSLISLTSLPYGNYTIPLKIQDQQGLQAEDVLQVVVCDCIGTTNKCRDRLPHSIRLGPLAIGLLLAGLLLMALLLLSFYCNCKSKNFHHIPLNLHEEGIQTLAKYNEEGGGSIYKPNLGYASHASWKENLKISSAPPEYLLTDGYRNDLRSSSGYGVQNSWQEMSSGVGVMNMQHHNMSMVRRDKESFRNESRRMSRTHSIARTDRNLEEHIERKISGILEEQRDFPAYSPVQYEYEGGGSDCQSLDQLTISNHGDNLDFLHNLGPKFNTLGGICRQSVESPNIRL
ncbi:cadherin-like protein 26 [Carassius auratus]|uniref:Cadherin-like protein 26 n=1 Tax=Carassius auratus TaxID=7957 RepID=A0A6P6MUZ0_CARAU|nr:cadherin-like protein 26 [Carassius auratus]